MRNWLSLAALAAGAVLLAASALARPAAPGGGTLRVVATIDIDYVDPALANFIGSWQVENSTCLKLVNLATAGGGTRAARVMPEAAALPRISSNGKRYEFDVRANFTRFSNGERVTARSFKAAIDRVAAKRMASPAQSFVKDIVGAKAAIEGFAAGVSGVRVREARLIIDLTAPASDFLARLTMPFFCAIPIRTPRNPDGVSTLPGAGPYYVASWQPRRSLVLRRNPHYRGPRPRRFAEIVYEIGLRSSDAFDRVEAGKADWLPGWSWFSPVPGRFVASPRARHAPGLAMTYLVLNATAGRPFANLRLRRAVSYALDRTAIVTAAGPLSGRPADHYVPRGVPGYNGTRVYPLRTDLAKARELARGLVPLTVRFSPCGEPAVWQEITRELSAIDVRLESVRRPCYPFGDMYIDSWHSGYGDPAEFLRFLLNPPPPTSGRRPAPVRFTDAVWRRRLARAESLPGRARLAALGRLDIALARDAAPAAALYAPEERELFSDRVGCFRFHPIYVVDLAALCLR